MKNKITKLEKDKSNADIQISKLKLEINKLISELSEYKSNTNKSKSDFNSNLREIKILKEKIAQYEKDINSLNRELDQYERERKKMETEIRRLQNENKSLKDKIKELNIIIEKLKSKSSVSENTMVKKVETRNKNKLFTELYEKFSKKKLIKYKIDMIIGMFIQQQKKDCEKKHSRLLEEINNYKRRLSQLNKELNIYKYGKKNPSNAEDFKNKLNINTETAITSGGSQILKANDGGKGIKSLKQINSHRSNSYGITRVVETTSQEIGNAIITTKTTQISYKCKKGSKNQK